MKALLIQSLILLLATVAHAYTPELEAETHDITLDITPIAITAKQRNMRYLEKDQKVHIKKMAVHFCNNEKYARVAETPNGEPMYRIAAKPATELPTDRPLMAWTANGVTSVDSDYATRWTTTNKDERNQSSKIIGSGPAVVFTRLRCSDKYQ